MDDSLLQNAYRTHRAGDIAAAIEMYQQILQSRPEDGAALYLLGVAHYQRGELEPAAQFVRKSLTCDGRAPEVWFIYGNILSALQRFDEAVGAFDEALKRNPERVEYWVNRGVAFLEMERPAEALESVERALAIEPGKLEALINSANAKYQLGRFDEACSAYERILEDNPDELGTLNNYGVVLTYLKRNADASACFDRVLAIAPDHADALVNQAVAFIQMGRYDEAVRNCNRALELHPGNPKPLINRALAQFAARDFEASARDYEEVLRIAPELNYAHGHLFASRLHCCDWRHIESDRQALSNGIHVGKNIAGPPEAHLAFPDPQAHRICAELWMIERQVAALEPLWRGERYEHDKIRIAYMSTDFGRHPDSRQLVAVLEAHDRTRFELIAISFGAEESTPLRKRIESCVDEFIEIANMGDAEAAALMRNREIDIAVDLTGHTTNSRPGILARRPAPLQTNFLGSPATSGASFIDYIVADRFVVPEGHAKHYCESVVYLPDSFMPTDASRAISQIKPSRAEAGLPDEGFVYCCFNSSSKITPEIFDVWMRLLNAVPNSVLWLASHRGASDNLMREADERGISPERLIFAPHLASDDAHLARLSNADLFLDTLPYNARTTAVDALWAGLPVLTCTGGAFPGRVGTSLLEAMGAPELITSSLEEYEARALALAGDPAQLKAVRERIMRNRKDSALFDTERYCRNLEAAYRKMHDRHQHGERPASFAVE